MTYTKKRVLQHIMEDRSVRMVREALPAEWVVREYKPDYGIDLTVELFEFIDEARIVAATLGETLFVQVKSTQVLDAGLQRVHRRRNVELGPLQEDTTESKEIEVARLQLETSELLTVQAMGAAIPVLLFLVEISTGRIYFVCLNDLVEKVILPEDPDYHLKASKVIHIPLTNRIVAGHPASLVPLRTYAKRPKLYAAFEKFRYQLHELQYATGRDEMVGLVRHFLAVVLRYDFWSRIPEWWAVHWSYRELLWVQDCARPERWSDDRDALQRFLLSQPGRRWDEEFVRSLSPTEAQSQFLGQIVGVWERLVNLSGMYEEVVKEWHLPTYLATPLRESPW